ncbi:hypothetical protein LLB_3187 [Legionella longbeachae D-4968]|nr:hypothetical protein LLB_3187 [Legionella longbeachae D-4968]
MTLLSSFSDFQNRPTTTEIYDCLFGNGVIIHRDGIQPQQFCLATSLDNQINLE